MEGTYGSSLTIGAGSFPTLFDSFRELLLNTIMKTKTMNIQEGLIAIINGRPRSRFLTHDKVHLVTVFSPTI